MQKYFRIAATAGSVLAFSALAGLAGSTASAQPPSTVAPAVQPEDTADDTDKTDDFLDEAPADQGSDAGGGSGAPATIGAPKAPGATVPAPAELTGTAPAMISPDTAPLGSSGGGGTGGNGRPTQDPIKSGC